MSGNTITITCSEGGKSISFSVIVKEPSGSAQAPYPAVIALGGPSIPIAAGVATITYNNQDIAVDNHTARASSTTCTVLITPPAA